jgi:glycosyltransferase involved in cell wall biosynthesis
VPSVVAQSWQPFRLGPSRRLRAFAGHDLVQFELCTYADWMDRAPGLPVYSAHNVEIDYARAQPSGWLARSATLRRIEALERRAVRRSALVVACTDPDAARLRELYGPAPPIETIPNGYPGYLERFSRSELRARARESLGLAPDHTALLFVGGRARHNLRAVELLERQVLPQLGEGARLLLVGRCGEASTAGTAAVIRLGFVEDMRPVLAAADVALNPVTFGSGSNVKLAEYLGAGLPVVTTPLGTRGFDQDLELLRVAEPDGFAEAIAALRDERARPGVERRGAESWNELGARLHAAFRRLLAR